MKKIGSREDLKTLREKYKDNVIMRLVSDDAANRVEVLCYVGKCGIEAGARDTMKAVFDEVNAKRLEKVSVLVADCSNGCDNPDAPKIDGKFACGSDRAVDVIFPGSTPERHSNVDAAKAKEIVSGIAARLEGK
jgi:NADP-reducing hydrogenase subunit HndB